MSFSCRVNALPCLHSYEKAEAFFNNTKPMRGKSMPENERPMHRMRGGSYKKYRVAKVEVHGREAYDLILFNTSVIRYFKPNPDGSRHISLRIYPSQSTTSFAWHHGWMQRWMLTTEGTEVAVYYPFGNSSTLSAFLTLDINNRLETARSWHPLMCKYLSSEQDKQHRKEFKKHLDNVFDLLHVQEYSIRERAVSSLDRSLYLSRAAMRDAISDVTYFVNSKINDPSADVMLKPETIECLLHKCADRLQDAAATEVYKEMHNNPKYTYDYHNWNKRKEYIQERTPQLIAILDMKKVITKVRDELLSGCGFMVQTKKIKLPLFPTEKHKGSVFTDREAIRYEEQELLDRYKQV